MAPTYGITKLFPARALPWTLLEGRALTASPITFSIARALAFVLALLTGWMAAALLLALICSHPPALPSFGEGAERCGEHGVSMLHPEACLCAIKHLDVVGAAPPIGERQDGLQAIGSSRLIVLRADA